MKLARYWARRRLWVGRVEDDHLVPLSWADGAAGQTELLRLAMEHNDGARLAPAVADPVPVEVATILSPIPDPPSIRDFYAFEAHAATARRSRGLELDPAWYERPVFYFTNPAAVHGQAEEITAPAGSTELDYELEVAAVVGRSVQGGEKDVLSAVAGYTIMNDWSARDLQRAEMRLGLGPAKGKDFATSLGPFLVTPDELPGPPERPRAVMTARVDGTEYSRGELADLAFGWDELLAHAARDTRLRAGDVVGSGTVGTGCVLELAGVHGHDRFPWLSPGQLVELEVEGIGTLANRIREREVRRDGHRRADGNG